MEHGLSCSFMASKPVTKFSMQLHALKAIGSNSPRSKRREKNPGLPVSLRLPRSKCSSFAFGFGYATAEQMFEPPVSLRFPRSKCSSFAFGFGYATEEQMFEPPVSLRLPRSKCSSFAFGFGYATEEQMFEPPVSLRFPRRTFCR